MSDDVKPALTASEWADGRTECGTVYLTVAGEVVTVDYATGERALSNRRHALAALALHGTPEGFTREMVAALRNIEPLVYIGWQMDLIHAAADRIAALLLPEPTDG